MHSINNFFGHHPVEYRSISNHWWRRWARLEEQKALVNIFGHYASEKLIVTGIIKFIFIKFSLSKNKSNIFPKEDDEYFHHGQPYQSFHFVYTIFSRRTALFSYRSDKHTRLILSNTGLRFSRMCNVCGICASTQAETSRFTPSATGLTA